MIDSIDLQELGNLYSQLGGTWTGCGDAVDLATLAKCAAVKACRYGYPFSAVGNCIFRNAVYSVCKTSARSFSSSSSQFVTVPDCYLNSPG